MVVSENAANIAVAVRKAVSGNHPTNKAKIKFIVDFFDVVLGPLEN